MRCSLHKARKPQQCDLCGTTIPARVAPDYAEYWKIKGGERGDAKLVCCVCHFLYGLPTDGWENSPNGRDVMAASIPV